MTTPPSQAGTGLVSAHTEPSLTLTRAELVELTGTKQPKRMTAWLTERGWVFEPPRGRDIPKVDRTYYLARMSGRIPTARRAGPNLDFLDKR